MAGRWSTSSIGLLIVSQPVARESEAFKWLETGRTGCPTPRIDLKTLENGLHGRDYLDFGTVRHLVRPLACQAAWKLEAATAIRVVQVVADDNLRPSPSTPYNGSRLRDSDLGAVKSCTHSRPHTWVRSSTADRLNPTETLASGWSALPRVAPSAARLRLFRPAGQSVARRSNRKQLLDG